METIKEIDFEFFDEAHSYMDSGGDIFGIHMWNTSYADEWYLFI